MSGAVTVGAEADGEINTVSGKRKGFAVLNFSPRISNIDIITTPITSRLYSQGELEIGLGAIGFSDILILILWCVLIRCRPNSEYCSDESLSSVYLNLSAH